MPTVMVVDDDAGIRSLFLAVFRLEGFEVSSFASGESALQALHDRAAKPDVIVLDLNMPDMDGREFFQELRAGGDPTPVVIVSAHGARAASRELGTEGFLDKPIDPDELVAVVRSHVELRT